MTEKKQAVRRPKSASDVRVASPAEHGRELDLGLLPHFVGYALRRAQIAVFDDAIRALGSVDLRPAQFSVMLVIRNNPGSKQTQIAEALGIQRPNMVSLLDALERRGLAERVRSASDRRSHAVRLTNRGESVLTEALALLAAHEKRMDERIGADGKAHFLATLQRIARTD